MIVPYPLREDTYHENKPVKQTETFWKEKKEGGGPPEIWGVLSFTALSSRGLMWVLIWFHIKIDGKGLDSGPCESVTGPNP